MWFQAKIKTSRAATPLTRRCRIEWLEDRRLLSAVPLGKDFDSPNSLAFPSTYSQVAPSTVQSGSMVVTPLQIDGTASPITPSGAITSATPTFQWGPASGAAGYYLSVVDETTNTQALGPTAVPGTSYAPTIQLLNGHTYAWAVQPFDALRETGQWSNTLTFSVNLSTVSGTASLVSPIGVINTNMPTYHWEGVGGAAGYFLSVIDETTGNSVISPTRVNGTSITPNVPLANGHNFAWSVQAFDGSGNPGAWTPSQGFMVSTSTAPLGTPAASRAQWDDQRYDANFSMERGRASNRVLLRLGG